MLIVLLQHYCIREVAMDSPFAQRVREQRKANGWSLEQFAETAGLSPNYVGDIVRG